MLDATQVLTRVKKVLADTDADPYLVGYDVNEIQALVTASSRPIAMRGASEAIAKFDKDEESRGIFAGGGRGIQVVRGAEAAAARCEELTRRFHDVTRGATLAAASVKLDKQNPRGSLQWLRQKLDLGKDAAPKPAIALPDSKADQCESCRANRGTTPRNRGGRDELVCERCDAMIRAGGNEREMAQSLNDLSPTGRVAAVSADGNNFGALFDALDTLQEFAIISTAVREIFERARHAAQSKFPPRPRRDGKSLPSIVSVAVGGDDLRAFVAEEIALTYVRTLVTQLETVTKETVSALANISDVSPSARRHLSELGVGFGLVASDSHFPAYRLMEYAHEMERSAKRGCSGNTRRSRSAARFALDFAVLRSGHEFIHGFDDADRDALDIRPIEFGSGSDRSVWKQARALARVPTAQQAIFAEAARRDDSGALAGPPDEEMASLLRYQVARSKEWQAYYEACGASWKVPEHVERFRPRQGLFDLLRLMGDDDGSL